MIKKSFFTGILIATAMSGAMVLSSCSNDAAEYSPEKAQAAKHAEALAKYKQAFVEVFGQPASNQCWDFTTGATFASTRAASDSVALSSWPSPSAYVYGFNDKYATGGADPLPQNTVANTIKKQAKDGKIQRAIADSVKANKFKTWAPTGSYVFRTAFSTCKTASSSDKYYSIGANFDNHNNIMAQMGMPKNSTIGVVKNGSTGNQHTRAINFASVPNNATWFAVTTGGQSSSIVASKHVLTQYVEVIYDGRTYWGFDCSGNGTYTDLVLWVDEVELSKELILAKRYMVEDLGGGGASDLDFNDIVFDLQQYSDGSQNCVVRALGGTLPITIIINNDEDYSWSKPEPVNEIINTKGTITGEEVIAEFPVLGWNPKTNNVQVRVQDKNDYIFITSFPEDGTIPCMVAFSTGKLWNAEQDRVKDAKWFTTNTFYFNFKDFDYE